MPRLLAPRLVALATLGLICTLHAPEASAQPAGKSAEAESHVTKGIELREQGHDDAALDEFRKAYALAPAPRTRAQIALAEQALGSWLAAEDDLKEALRASSDPWIVKNGQPLRDALAVIGQHLGTLELRFLPESARGGDVLIDGARRAGVPLEAPLRVEAGQRALEVRVTGDYPVSRTVVVPAGGIARETIELHPQHDAPAAAAGGATPATPAPLAKPGGETKTSGGGSALSTLGWVFVGTSVALLATGVVGQFVRQGNISSYNSDPTCPGEGSAAQPASCADLVHSAQTWNTVSIVSFIGGGVFASSGVVLLLVGGSSSSSSSGGHAGGIRCGPFGCAGTF